MPTSRRTFFQSVGAGAAGLGLSTAVATTTAEPAKAAEANDGSGVAHAPSVIKRSLNWPIKSELKSRRIKFETPQNQISWAYMKELRENNKTRKIYPVNPYVEVYQFRDNLYELF